MEEKTVKGKWRSSGDTAAAAPRHVGFLGRTTPQGIKCCRAPIRRTEMAVVTHEPAASRQSRLKDRQTVPATAGQESRGPPFPFPGSSAMDGMPTPGHEPSRQSPVIVATTVMLALSTTTVALRFYDSTHGASSSASWVPKTGQFSPPWYVRALPAPIVPPSSWSTHQILSVGVTVGFVRRQFGFDSLFPEFGPDKRWNTETRFARGRHVWMVTDDDMLHFNMVRLFPQASAQCVTG